MITGTLENQTVPVYVSSYTGQYSEVFKVSVTMSWPQVCNPVKPSEFGPVLKINLRGFLDKNGLRPFSKLHWNRKNRGRHLKAKKIRVASPRQPRAWLHTKGPSGKRTCAERHPSSYYNNKKSRHPPSANSCVKIWRGIFPGDQSTHGNAWNIVAECGRKQLLGWMLG